MKLLIDECLSPQLARRLGAEGWDAIHPRDRGFCGAPDHRILERCLDEDRVLVTHNAEDFRQLVGAAELHPGLVILPENNLVRSWSDLRAVVAFVVEVSGGAPAAYMVNRVVEIDRDGRVSSVEIPPP